MKVYLAARYSHAEALRPVASALATLGHEVTSRWIYLGLEDESRKVYSTEERAALAADDWGDLLRAECVISFTGIGGGRGGRHVEFGGALALGKRLLLVGEREHVFHCLPQVQFHATWDECLAALSVEVR